MTALTVQTLPSRSARRRSQHPSDLDRTQQTRSYLLEASATSSPISRARLLDMVVLVNLPVADRLALRYSGRGIPSQDLVQVARLGLVRAVHRFDPGAGFDFLSYAVPTVLGELKRHFRDRGWTVRPPRRIQELQPRILAATSTLTHTLVRTPTRAEVSDYLGVDEACVVEALIADGCFTPTSLDRPVVDDSRTSSTWGDTLGTEDPALAWVEAKLTLAPVFRRLPDRDRHVLRLRFIDDLTQREIGGIVGVSQVHVSRILARILRLAQDELAR
jgi:RNA polymerase sigma-B factor